MTSEQDLKTSARRSGSATVGIALQRAAFVCLALAMSCVAESAVAANTLHLTGTHRTAAEHDYEFSGHYDTVEEGNYAAERIHLAVKGKYVKGVATETLTIFAPKGQGTYSGSWSCAKDPWLNPTVSCISVAPQAAVGSIPFELVQRGYFETLCKSYPDGYCFLSRKLVPAGVAKLMRDGPPAPSVSGVKFTHHAPVKMTLHYAAKRAEHFYLDEWYCPPGKDEAPGDVPNGDSTSFPGGACQDSKSGPRSLSKGANTTTFGIGKPAGQPKNGTWYVRASLNSASYGRGLWGHWHRTVVQLPMHFKDAPNNKPAPDIVAPAEDYVWSEPSTHVVLKLKSNITGKNITRWSYDIQWQRQRYVTKANAQAYDALHKGGFPSRIGALEDMHPWSVNNNLAVDSNPVSLNSLSQLNYQEMRSRSVEFSYRYRVRARDDKSNWSPWRYFIVEESVPKSSGFRRSSSLPESLPTQPPEILSPAENQIIAAAAGATNKYIKFSVRSHVKNPKADHWRMQLEWKRAIYHTKANNDMYYCKYGRPKKNEFPRRTGVVPPLKVWDDLWTPTSAILGSGDSMWDPEFRTYSPGSTLFSYLYEFRVRVQRVSPEAYGPWSPWRSFVVENTAFNKCTAVSTKGKPAMGGIGIHVSGQTQQQSGQHTQQRALRPSAVRIGSAVKHTLALHQPAPPMHTMSGSLNSPKAPAHRGGTPLRGPRISLRSAPHLRVLNHVATADPSCANLARFITIHETVTNDGGPLAAGRAKLYVKETGGAHISSRAVPVPALAHGAIATLTLRAGTRERYRAKVPGQHTLPVFVVVNGKTMRTNVVEGLRPNLCQVHRRAAHPLRSTPGVKLNPQPEPPSAPRRLAIPHR